MPGTASLCTGHQSRLVDNSIINKSSEGIENIGDEDELGWIELDDGDVGQQFGALDNDLQRLHSLVFLPRLYQRRVQLLNIHNNLLQISFRLYGCVQDGPVPIACRAALHRK